MLLMRLRREQIAGKNVMVFKPGIDERWGSGKVVSRNGSSMEAQPVADVREVVALAAAADVVALDEAQFFGAEIVAVCGALADQGKRVIVAGLDATFRREGFGLMPELLATAEFVDKIPAVCHRCGAPAFFTQRLIDGHPAPFAGETVVVGSDEYEARCRACFEPA
jgi:thymidine kinase